jgi:hypothetical protein
MPSDNRQKLLSRIRALATIPADQWKATTGSVSAPSPTVHDATLETLALIGELTDDWNAEIHDAHEVLAQETEKLTVATKNLDASTSRLGTVTWVLIAATTVLAMATVWHVVLLLRGH